MKPFRSLPLVAATLLAGAAALIAQDAPVPDAPVPDAPAQDAPAQDAPAQDAPAQDDPAAVNPAARNALEVPAWQLAFRNLDPTLQKEYGDRLEEATRLFNQKRIFEALNEVGEAEKIFDQSPAALNLRGACYVEFRDFKRARAIFQQAYELQKAHLENLDGVLGEERKRRMRPVVNILFNLAEMDFVTGRWQDCHDRIEQILPVMESGATAMSRLIEFKLLLCKLKLGQVEEARKLAEKYDYSDDYPYYYYANSAIAYFDGDAEAAERWRATARKVFRHPEVLAPWEDTMIEFGYVKSFYGGDLADE